MAPPSSVSAKALRKSFQRSGVVTHGWICRKRSVFWAADSGDPRSRREYNVLGDTVNVAYRMQEVAGPYKVIVGPSTMAAIADKFRTVRIGAIALRGREKPIQVYEVIQ